MTTTTQRISGTATFAVCALVMLALCLLRPAEVRGQWTTPDASQNINNTNTGNVGIGTTVPAYKLDLSNAGDKAQIRFGMGASDTGGYLFSGGPSHAALSGGASWSGGWIARSLSASLIEANVGQLVFYANSGLSTGSPFTPAERMRISSSGFVGIGTANPEASLHIATDSTSTPRGFIIQQGNSSQSSAFLVLRKGRGTVGSPTTVVNGDSLGNIYSEAYDGTAFLRTGAGIKFVSNGAVAPGSVPTDILFSTGSSGLGTEQMRITSGSNVGIGTASPGYKLDVAGQVRSSSGGFVFPDTTVQATAATGIFKNVANAAGATQFSAASNNDALRFEGTGGTTVSFDAPNKKITINSTGGSASGWTDGGATVSLTNASAKVGIGTTTASDLLHVANSQNGATIVRVDNPDASGNGAYSGIRFYQGGTLRGQLTSINDGFVGGLGGPGALQLWNPLNANIIFGTNAAERLRIQGNGNVGIGTGSPNALLDLASSTQLSNRIRLSGQEYFQAGNTSTHGIDIRLGTNRTGERQIWFVDSANAINATTAQLRMRFQGSYASLDSISTDGTTTLPLGLNATGGSNVGIGTTTPGYKLDVAGHVRSGSGGFVFPDATIQATAAAGIFKNVANSAGVAQFSAASNNDALRFEGTGGTTVSFDAPNKKIVINSSGGSGSSGWTDSGATVSLTNLSAKVGIGTATPSSGLDVQNPVTAVVANGVRLQQALTAGNNNAELNGLLINTTFVDGMAVGVRHNALVTGAGNIGFGTSVTAAGLDVQNAGVSTSGATYGARFQQTLPSAGNNAVSTAVHINPTFNDGMAVGVKHNGLVVAAGDVGIGTATPAAKLDVVGSVNASGNLNVGGTITGGTIHAKYQDVAEWVESSQSLPAGTVVVLDHTKSNQVVASNQAYDTRVAGVISTQPGITLGESGAAKVLVATTGRVKIKVDATKAPIQVGDLLVTGDKEGFAMKSLPLNIGGMQLHRPGTLVGKALEPLARGTGEILVLLSLQ